jgi:hypothetical protein
VEELFKVPYFKKLENQQTLKKLGKQISKRKLED